MVSIIIPVLNEEKNIEKILMQLNNLKVLKEIIVVDGGSTDNTVLIASKYAKVISSPKGRAKQMNNGALISKGEILWFLHCDSKISERSIESIEKAISKGYDGGCLSLYFYDYSSPFLKYISCTSNLRAKYLKLYFGDQGIFIKKSIFEGIGGYKDIPLMEDFELSIRLKKTAKTVVLKEKIGTSARRFIEGGCFKTFLLMQYIKLLYILNVPIEKIASIYKDIR
ncbi:transferase 2, rSAM/selenodomain-associated [Caloramator quimbayensis]|uniref:4,4'-diaponeurosporenoate glycosyltransferase n=1 Tax=Caloramator quimbayensis TaxID=1147123 RepID=A0A1T4X0E1_9CLOT|nr:TIGR04283 family arsenosugar biosynthesis glycosyltransferase [Caloramator quimbayensis]SKA83070.1 transferase 2, rSAM/selenodomain-associated [Caloramator quimbayensis]